MTRAQRIPVSDIEGEEITRASELSSRWIGVRKTQSSKGPEIHHRVAVAAFRLVIASGAKQNTQEPQTDGPFIRSLRACESRSPATSFRKQVMLPRQ